MSTMKSGFEICADVLEEQGIQTVFSVPGTQNIALLEAFRKANIEIVIASNEMAATFMALGYFRVSGRLAAVSVIPGPGFCFSLNAISEAKADSAALLLLVGACSDGLHEYALQKLPIKEISQQVAKAFFCHEESLSVGDVLRGAIHEALLEEPGPVICELSAADLCRRTVLEEVTSTAKIIETEGTIADLQQRLAQSMRTVFFIGGGAVDCSKEILDFIEKYNIPVFSTCSGRGIVSDTHPQCILGDFSLGLPAHIAELVERCDLIVAWGVKFTHNGTAGFELEIPSAKLIEVNCSKENLGKTYSATLQIYEKCKDVLDQLSNLDGGMQSWTTEEIQKFRNAGEEERRLPVEHEPKISGTKSIRMKEFFDGLHQIFPECIYVTDSGLHQLLARRYLSITQARGLIVPADFQSMAFCLPAALGAAKALPGKRIVALSGDGGILMTLAELLTLKRQAVPVTVIIFSDGKFGLIHRQQVEQFGKTIGTNLPDFDVEKLCAAFDVPYTLFQGDIEKLKKEVTALTGPIVVNVVLDRPLTSYLTQSRSVAREGLRSVLPSKVVAGLKKLIP